MTTLLHLDASVRDECSLSRRLSAAFVDAWRAAHPSDRVLRQIFSPALDRYARRVRRFVPKVF